MVTKDKNYQRELMDETIKIARKEKQPKHFLLPEVPANIATFENPGKDVVPQGQHPDLRKEKSDIYVYLY